VVWLAAQLQTAGLRRQEDAIRHGSDFCRERVRRCIRGEDECFIFTDAILADDHLFVAVDDEIATWIVATFAAVRLIHTRDHIEHAGLALDHDGNLPNAHARHRRLLLLNHAVFVDGLRHNIHVHVELSAVRQIVHARQTGRHQQLRAILSLEMRFRQRWIGDFQIDFVLEVL